jgi:segregation and condensation protein A
VREYSGPVRYGQEVAYRVTTPVFEGPIDLLLHLVNSHEADPLDIPLAPVVDGFVAELAARRRSMPLDVVSEFLLVAAILVQVKSQRLLPEPEALEDDEELVGWEERDLLLSRLLECRAYAAVAELFVGMAEGAARSVPRQVGLDEGLAVRAPDLLAGLRPEQLARAYLRIRAEPGVPDVDLSHVTVDTVTVSETVQELAEQLPARGPTSFRQLTAHLENRMAVIVHFLALLELCKLGKVTIGQGETFGDLQVDWVGEQEPLTGALVGGLLSDEYEG